MNVTTINKKKNMTYKHYIKQPMQTVEVRPEMNIAKIHIL